MASSLSEEEFVRMQMQLLELREQNYQASDRCAKQERDLQSIRSQYEILDREYQKAVKAINKSKKAKEVEQLIQETDSLQRKLVSQEEEFRLQNETLMQELGQLVTLNENLEKENTALKESGSSPSQEKQSSSQHEDDLRRLQAQNTALQKNLSSCQEKYEGELNTLRQTITDLEAQCVKLSGQRGTPVGEGSTEDRTVEGQSDPDCSQDGNSTSETAAGSSGNNESTPLPGSSKSISSQIEDLSKEANDLRLSLDTEKEEKRILKEELQSLEKKYATEIQSVQEELEKLTEKYKKKQESLVQLQEEKEKLYSELRILRQTTDLKLEEVETEKNGQIEVLQSQTGKLQSEISQCNEVMKDYEQKSHNRIQELENLVTSLETQVDESSAENNQQLSEQNVKFQGQLQDLQGQVQTSRKQIADLEAQLQEARNIHSSTLEQMNALQQDRDQQIQALQEANRVAEKRKMLLDELAIRYQEESDQHREQVKSMEEKHTKEIEKLTTELDELQIKVSELEDIKEELELLKSQATSLENAKGWLERRLNEVEQTLSDTKDEHASILENSMHEHEEAVKDIQVNHEKELESKDDEISALNKEKEDLNDSISSLKQKLKDGVDEKKIHEKKGMTMLKDLKRQLQAERKRGDKLQERLQELLAADNRSRQSVEDLFRPTDPNDRYKGDNSSVGSWSASGISKDASGLAVTPEEETNSGILEQENADLLKRLSEAQQEKWNLEEKVNHLESSNAAMADDLLKKTAIIEHYVMNGKDHIAQSPSQEKITLKRVVDFVKDKGDENLRDMNRKLQRMLEETLTKNMHLQKDLEMLSQEVVRLSKQGPESCTVQSSN